MRNVFGVRRRFGAVNDVGFSHGSVWHLQIRQFNLITFVIRSCMLGVVLCYDVLSLQYNVI